ncbi:MAG: TonB-dependent receptor [Deltaproteobacteria bacterium]
MTAAHLQIALRAGPAAAGAAGVSIQSDDGQQATTAEDGRAVLELTPGKRSLRLSLPLPLTPAHPGPDPKVILLEGIELNEGLSAELRASIGPDGTPASLELVALPPPTPSTPAGPAAGSEAAGQYGAIAGTVVAKGAGASVSGVSLFVEGRDGETTSDVQGRFRLQLPVGRYTVWVIHPQFPTLTLPNVEVRAGRDTPIQVELVPPTTQTDDWVIRANYVAGGVASILEERRTSSSVSDALGSEEISRSVDSSASSATRRIVGASIVGGQYLFARGLGGRYTNVRLNGVPLPSTDPDLPGFQLDLFPASLLSSLTITKTFSPDIPGDFAGGSLNVVTRAFPEKLKVTLSSSLSYNTETTGQSIPNYEGGSWDWLGHDDGTRALPGAVPDQRVWNGSGLGLERMLEISRAFPGIWEVRRGTAPPNLSLGASVGDTLALGAGRLGYLFTLGYRSKFEHYSEGITNIRLEGEGEGQRVVQREGLTREVGNQEALLGLLGSVSYEPMPQQRLSIVSLLTQAGEDRAAIITGVTEAEAAPVRNTQLRFVERRLSFNQLTGEHRDLWQLLTISWQLNLAYTLRDQPETRDLIYAEGPDGFAFRPDTGSGERLYSQLSQRDFGGGLNLGFALGKPGELKLGYLGRTGKRDFKARRFGVRFLGQASDRTLAPEDLLSPERAGETWIINEVTRPDDGFKANEDLNAGYALLDSPLSEAVRVVGGVRAENFHQKIDVVSPFDLGSTGVTEPPQGADRTELDFLPALAVIVAPSAQMNVRAGYGGTVARPLVRELAPFLNQDFVRRRYVVGNPELKRTFIHNLDLRWELFPSATEVFAISGFYKIFESPIENVVLDSEGNLTVENIERANNYGVELEARMGLGALSPALEAFDVMANLALIHSTVRLSPEQRVVATSVERPLAGQSPYVANLALGYNSEPLGLSAYLYYNVFGRRLQEVGTVGLPDVYEEPFHSLDATLFYKPIPQLTLGVSGSNLLLQPTRTTNGPFDFTRSERGANFGLSLGWSL